MSDIRFADASAFDFPNVDYSALYLQLTTPLSRIPGPIRTEIRALTDGVISLRLWNVAFANLHSLGYELEAMCGLKHASHALIPLSSKLGKPILLNVYTESHVCGVHVCDGGHCRSTAGIHAL